MNNTFCPVNDTFWPAWAEDGWSRCFMDVVPSCFILVLGFVLFMYNMCARRTPPSSYSALNEQSTDRCGGVASEPESDQLDVGFGGPYVELIRRPVPFLYFLQLLLCPVMAMLFLAQLTASFLILSGNLPASRAVYSVLNALAWCATMKTIQWEARRYHQRRRRHSIPLVLFLVIVFIVEVLPCAAATSPRWWFVNLGKDNNVLDLALFCSRILVVSLLLGLTMFAPGLEISKQGDNGSQVNGRMVKLTKFWHRCQVIWPFMWPPDRLLQFYAFLCILILVAGRIINVIVPLYYKKIVNYLSQDASLRSETEAFKLVGVYMSLIFLQGGLGGGSIGLLENTRSFLWVKVQQFSSRIVQLKLFEHLHRLTLRWHLSRKTGEVLRIVDRGADSIDSLLSYVLFNVGPTFVDGFVAVAYFGSQFNGWFALIVFLTMTCYVGCTVSLTEWRTKYRRDMNSKSNMAEAKAVDSLLNFETVKYYNNEEFEVNQYYKCILDYQKAEWLSNFSLNLMNTLQIMVVSLGLLSGTLLCTHLVISGNLTVGDYVQYVSYLLQLFTPLYYFGMYYRLIQTSFVDMENMFDLFSEHSEIKDPPNAPQLKIDTGMIVFKDVCFSYDNEKQIIKNVSFCVPPGQTMALVGPSGSGKSTIIRLLFRFYDTNSGLILIDGQNIATVTQKSLRKVIGVVPQDTVLFNDNIRYNIRYGRPDCSDEDVLGAAQAADIHEQILTFTNGYDTVVGERGLKLSGGEKQRIAIARTILKAPQVVLLDEATSSLDTQTERNIQTSLEKVCANRTTIIVAHRLSTIIHADQIVVLKDGVIVETGRHRELLDRQGVYYSMWQQQLESHEGEGPNADTIPLTETV